jgi:hypothetical protein
VKWRLRDIINLMTVSKQLQAISLLEENWHIITDTKNILYDFIRKIYRSTSISYPINKIRQIRSTDCIDMNYSELLRVATFDPARLTKFYKYFSNYQSLYFCDTKDITTFCEQHLLTGIYIIFTGYSKEAFELYLNHQKITTAHTITEICAPGDIINCNFLIKYYPHITHLEVDLINNKALLKQTRLKCLRVNGFIMTDELIPHLPDTIESLVITNGLHTATLFDQLGGLPHLSYLKINLSIQTLSTPIRINTIHFVITQHHDITIDIPNVQNIIITKMDDACHIKKLHVVSLNAQTCQLLHSDMSNFLFGIMDVSIILPKCPKVIIRNNNYDLPLGLFSL